MPIDDDGSCFFCGATLWNLDGMCACENGCGAYEILPEDPKDEIRWVVRQSVLFKIMKERNGQLYGVEEFKNAS